MSRTGIHIIKIIISVVITGGIVYYLYRNGYFLTFSQAGGSDWAVLLLLTLASYFVSGWQLWYLVRFISSKSIHWTDILFMPMSMSLFGYIIPANGGFLYSVYFLKKKNAVDTTNGFSVAVVTLYLSFIVSGLAFLIASWVTQILEWHLLLIALALVLSPLLVTGGNMMLALLPLKAGSRAERARKYLDSVIRQSNSMLLNRQVVLMNFLFTLVSLFLFFMMYFWINKSLGLGLSMVSLLALLALMRISSLIRILPGNLGLEELFTAGLFGLIGHDPSVGLVFSVFLRFCSVIIMIPFGISHTAFNTKYFSMKDLRHLLPRRKKRDEQSTPG